MSQANQRTDQHATNATGVFEAWLTDLRRHERVSARHPLPSVDAIDYAVRRIDRGVDLPALFLEQAAAAGCSVVDTRGEDWRTTVVELLAECGAREVLLDDRLADDDHAALRKGLEQHGASAVSAESDDELFAVDAAVTGVATAIAETGTFVWTSGPAAARAATLVPPLHVAVISSGQVVPDLCDYFATLADDAELPANVNLITGPSKTADIEGILITGVHGPGVVHVVLTD